MSALLEMAAFGKNTLVRQTLYGLHVRVRLDWPNVITRFDVTRANVHELAAIPALAEQTTGMLIGGHNYWSPTTTAE